MSETLSARAQVASLSRWHPDDPVALQAAKDRLLLANLRALLDPDSTTAGCHPVVESVTKEDEDHE